MISLVHLLRSQTTRRWKNLSWLQYPKRAKSPLSPEINRWNANLCEDSHWQNNHFGCWIFGLDRKCQSQN